VNLYDMTRDDFERLPWRESWSEEAICDSLVILPAKVPRWRFWWHTLRVQLAKMLGLAEPEIWESVPMLHDSGYACMDYVAVINGEAICRISGCSDVLHIEGIGGFGHRWLDKSPSVPRLVPVSGWQFDCLPKSGLLRLWPSSRKHIIYGCSLSSFEIYSTDEEIVSTDSKDWTDYLEEAKRLLGGGGI